MQQGSSWKRWIARRSRRYVNSFVRVDHNEIVTVSIHGGAALDSDIDDFKGVIWWSDPGHGSGQPMDDVDLGLYTTGGVGLRTSFNANDEKIEAEGM